ncbi:methyl-accepting chemotaxis protein [Sulfurimonas sp. HSL-1716]|uniref:methyl-accepting chemotaxis protein n=1 Tax=Hydrocurvibacter sulfurireducens TaxID=3131937 RepID=UPI0031F92445
MNVQKLKLATMFSIMFAGAFITISAIFYYYGYVKQKESLTVNLKSQATAVLNFADVLLDSRNEKFFSGESTEIPQIIQNEVFDRFTDLSKGKVFFKEASKTPTNIKNKATAYEAAIIDRFQNDKKVKEIEENIVDSNKNYYILARPIVAEEKCKMCHPTWTPGDVIAIEDARIDLNDFDTAINDNITLTIITGIINIVIILLLTHFLFSKYVSRRINKLLEVILRVEKGNFVIDDIVKDELLQEEDNDNEIDNLFIHLDQMVKALKPVIENVVNESKHMAFNASYGYVKIDQTNEHVRIQHHSLHSTKSKLYEIVEDNDKMQSTLARMLESSDNSKEIVSNSQKEVSKNLKQGSEAIESMENTTVTVQDLKTFSSEISKMMDVISDIADETNLISLNAAIEAARAGVHGRSFAVVADKIRELAEVSQKNADDIEEVLNKIDKQIDNVSISALNSKNSVVSLVESSNIIDKNFEEIKNSFNLISNYLVEFNTQFSEESVMLNDMNHELQKVEESSKVLVDNAEDSKHIMKDTADKSASLKTLADGFEVVLNSRSAKRTVITPPLKARDGNANCIYIFDYSHNGISFYDVDKNVKRQKGDKIVFVTKEPLDNKTEFECEIVYISQEAMQGIFFYGTKLL